MGNHPKIDKCPIENLRDVILAGEEPREVEVTAAMVKAQDIKTLAKGLLKPQAQNVNQVRRVPHLGLIA
ncbi:MAG: hypothetical protein KAI73_05205 [Rhodospirillaceae bacterium]|nr:hypothetical protein [Rhodospirillaceae bacterium]